MTNPHLSTCTPAQLRDLLVASGTPLEAMNLTIHTDGTLAVAPLLPAQDYLTYGPGKLQAYLHLPGNHPDRDGMSNREALDNSVMASILRDARRAIASGAFFYID